MNAYFREIGAEEVFISRNLPFLECCQVKVFQELRKDSNVCLSHRNKIWSSKISYDTVECANAHMSNDWTQPPESIRHNHHHIDKTSGGDKRIIYVKSGIGVQTIQCG